MSEPQAIRNDLTVGGKHYRLHEHATAKEIKAILGADEWKRHFTFGCARNPWDRVVSAYHFYRHGRAKKRVTSFRQPNPKAIANVLLANSLSFDYWLRFYRGKSCKAYLSDEDGEICVDRVLRMETLAEDYRVLCEDLAMPHEELERTNSSPRAQYQEYYNARTRDIVRRLFEDDIEAFGYEF